MAAPGSTSVHLPQPRDGQSGRPKATAPRAPVRGPGWPELGKGYAIPLPHRGSPAEITSQPLPVAWGVR